MPKGRGGAREGRRWGGGVFFRKQPRKDKRDGRGGGRGGRRDTEIIVLRY
jgi:hypothetical protein